MNCNYCSSQFDQTAHVPRLLIFCGHSLCEACCHQLHHNSRIQCPQCLSNTFIEEVNFLPKNLALLKVNSISSNSDSYCLKHQKKYEAFCKKQKVLICVDCILHDSHRNHQMQSIKNAHAQEQSALSTSLEYVENALRQAQLKYQENVNNQKLSTHNYENCLDSLIQYFQEIRELVQKQQQCLFLKLKQQYAESAEKFHQKNARYLSLVEQLTHSLGNLRQANKQSDIQFLSQVNTREEFIANINMNVEQSQKQLVLSYPKNLIADNIIKSIQKSFKTCNGAATTPSITSTNTKPASVNTVTKSKKPSSVHGQQMPSLISFSSQQMPSNQNSKPMAKKVTRKDPMAGVSHSGASSLIANKSGPNPPLGKSCTNVEYEKRSTIYNRQKPQERQKQKYDIAKNCDVSIVEQKQSLFNSFFSNMTSFLSEQKYIYAIGGFDDESSNMIKLNLNTLKWQHVSALKSPRSKFGCVAVEKNIYIMGGKKGKERLSDMQIWSEGHWKMAPSLKRKRSGFGIVSVQNFIYIIGGNDGQNILNGVQVLNTLTGQWSKAEPMAQARDQLAVCLGKDNRIYAIGGFGGKCSEPLKTVQMFDIKTQKWYKVASMLTQRRALAAAALADGIYAIGGFDGVKHLNSVQKYEEDGTEWVKIANLKRGRCTHSAISIFDTQQIIILGGFDQQALDSVEKYSLITNQWQQIAKLPSPRFMHSCLLLNQ